MQHNLSETSEFSGKEKKNGPQLAIDFFLCWETSTTKKKKWLGSLVLIGEIQLHKTSKPLKIFGKIWGSQTSLITGHQALHQRKPITWGIGQLLVGRFFFGFHPFEKYVFSLFFWCLGWAVVIVFFWRYLTETTCLEGHCSHCLGAALRGV